MGKWLIRLGAMVLSGVVLILTGCPSQQTKESSKGTIPKKLEPPASISQVEEPVEKEPIPIEVSKTLEQLEPEPKSIPVVKLTETLKKTCRVAVGDQMPGGDLTTPDGQKKSLSDLLGKGATVVFFWTAGNSEIAEKAIALSLADLQGDALAAYGEKGLAVVAINPKDSAGKVKEVLGSVEVAFPVLVDAGGSYFAKVATEKLPRVYVLDGTGKIAWFDVEFSELSREGLKQTLRVMLGDPAGK